MEDQSLGKYVRDIYKFVERQRELGNIAPTVPKPPVCEICSGRGVIKIPIMDENGQQRLNDDGIRMWNFTTCPHRDDEIRQKKVKKALESSNIKDHQRKQTFDTFEHGKSKKDSSRDFAFRRAEDYAKKLDRWMFLYGDTGSGKTHLALAICNYQIDNATGIYPIFRKAGSLLNDLRASYDDKEGVTYAKKIEAYIEAPLLVIDDLKAEKHSQFTEEQFFLIISEREDNGYPTIITSNFDPVDLPFRIASRLQDAGTVEVIHIDEPDYRKLKTANF